jgi:hypothetical protein
MIDQLATFGRWRQQFQIMLALDRLSEGDSIQTVAFALRYESSSAFATMFRKTLGKPRFLADRQSSRRQGDEFRPLADLKPRVLNGSVHISVRTVSGGRLLPKSLFLLVGRLATELSS